MKHVKLQSNITPIATVVAIFLLVLVFMPFFTNLRLSDAVSFVRSNGLVVLAQGECVDTSLTPCEDGTRTLGTAGLQWRTAYVDDRGLYEGGSLVVRSASVVVAASDASAASRAQADFLADGTADNVEIQAALDSLPAVGGYVQLTEGTFNIAATIIVRNEDALGGQGSRATILRLVADINLIESASFGTGPITRFYLEHLELDGDKANRSLGNGTYGNFIYADFVNVRFFNFAENGAVVTNETATGALENDFTRCTFRENANNGLYLQGKVGDNHIFQSTFFDNGGTAGSKSGSGIKLEAISTSYLPQHIYVTNSFIEKNEHGIDSENAKNLTFIGNDISQNDKHGINIWKDLNDTSSFFVINANDFFSNSKASGNTSDSIFLDGQGGFKAGRAVISSNVFSGNNLVRYNVNLGSDSQLSQVIANHFVGFVAGAINDDGTNNETADHNIGD